MLAAGLRDEPHALANLRNLGRAAGGRRLFAGRAFGFRV